MKRFLLTIVLFFVTISVSQAQALPENISQGCEQPRMRTLPYNTAELAQRYGTEAVSSLYLRPITNWQQTEDEEAFIFSASYVVPFTWLNRQALLYVEGASGAYEVLINGKVAGSTFNGFTPTEFNITKKSKEESNTISIRIFKSHWSQRLHTADTTKAYLGEVYVMSQPTIRVRNIVHNATLDATGEMANVEVGIVVKTESLNELAILRDRFGGKGAKAAIVTTEFCSAAARHRAAQLEIAVIDLEELRDHKLVERLKTIMKAP